MFNNKPQFIALVALPRGFNDYYRKISSGIGHFKEAQNLEDKHQENL
jgi:hypothetical protein